MESGYKEVKRNQAAITLLSRNHDINEGKMNPPFQGPEFFVFCFSFSVPELNFKSALQSSVIGSLTCK